MHALFADGLGEVTVVRDDEHTTLEILQSFNESGQ
jgi:hypothetical protein